MPKTTTPDPKPVMKRTNFFLPQELHDGLKTMRKRTEESEAEHVRKAVTNYLKRNKALA